MAIYDDAGHLIPWTKPDLLKKKLYLLLTEYLGAPLQTKILRNYQGFTGNIFNGKTKSSKPKINS
jgi:hypothetical protein